jgi:D-sedoheptulose 7-phosphate isomerase
MHNRERNSQREGGGAFELLRNRRVVLVAALEQLQNQAAAIDDAARRITAAIRAGGKLLIAGNGGSAAEAQHMAAEFVGRFLRERDAFPAIALCADSAILTAVANDYGYDKVFARQVAALGQPGDVLFCFSTSGESRNLIAATVEAAGRGLTIIAVTGERPNSLQDVADVTIRVPSNMTPVTQELHAVLLHALCDLVETALVASSAEMAVTT